MISPLSYPQTETLNEMLICSIYVTYVLHKKQCIMLNNSRVHFIWIEMNTKNIEQSLEISIYLIKNTHKTIRKRFRKKKSITDAFHSISTYDICIFFFLLLQYTLFTNLISINFNYVAFALFILIFSKIQMHCSVSIETKIS